MARDPSPAPPEKDDNLYAYDLYACRLCRRRPMEWVLCMPCLVYLRLVGHEPMLTRKSWNQTVDMPNYCERCEERCWSPEEFDAAAPQEEALDQIWRMLNLRRDRQTHDPIDYTRRPNVPTTPQPDTDYADCS